MTRGRVAAVGLIIFCLASGCQIRFGRPARAPENVVVRDNQTQCLSHFAEEVQQFFDGASSDQRVTQLWECADRSIEFFVKYVRGSPSAGYLPTDLRAFLHSYYLGDVRISDKLLAQAMQIKQLLIGGTAEILTLEELKRTRELIGLLKQVSLEVRPFMKIYTAMAPRSEVSEDRLEQAALVLENSAKQLAKVFASTELNYKLVDFSEFLAELQTLFDKTSGWPGPRLIEHHLPLFNVLRVIYTGGNRQHLKSNEWAGTLQAGSRILSQWLRYKYTLNQRPWQFGSGLETLSHFAFETISLIKESARHHVDKQIDFGDWEELFGLLGERDWLPFGLSAQVYKSLLRPFFSRAMYTWQGSQTRIVASAMELASIEQAEREFWNWYWAQRHAVEVSAPQFVVPNTRPMHYAEIPGSWRRFIELRDPPSGFGSVESIGQMKRLMSGPLHFNLDQRGAIKYLPESRSARYDFVAQTKLNWRRLIIHLAVRGYAEERERAVSVIGLTESEFHAFYKDVRLLCESINFLDPRDGDPNPYPIWKSVFVESNLFTPSAVGDTRLIAFEAGVEIMTMTFSSGAINSLLWRQIANEVSKKTNGSGIGELDIFGLATIKMSEFHQAYCEHFLEAYSNLGAITKEFRSRAASPNGPAQVDEFIKIIESAGSKPSAFLPEAFIDSGDLDKYSMLLQYVEGLYTLYDLDGSGTLSSEEFFRVFPRFRAQLSAQVDKLSGPARWYFSGNDHRLFLALSYMAENGRTLDGGGIRQGLADAVGILGNYWIWGDYKDVQIKPSDLIRLVASVRSGRE